MQDEAAQPIGVARVAETAEAAAALRNELAALRAVAADRNLRDSIPAVLADGQWAGCEVHVQACARPCVCGYTVKLTPAHLRFLAALSRVDRRHMPLTEWPAWEELSQRVEGARFASSANTQAVQEAFRAARGTLSGVKMPFHRVHGDFAPWNVHTAGGGICVLDWERSEPQGLPFTDLVHFGFQVEWLIRKRTHSWKELLASPLTVLGVRAECETLARALASAGGTRLNARQMLALVSLCLVKRSVETL